MVANEAFEHINFVHEALQTIALVFQHTALYRLDHTAVVLEGKCLKIGWW